MLIGGDIEAHVLQEITRNRECHPNIIAFSLQVFQNLPKGPFLIDS